MHLSFIFNHKRPMLHAATAAWILVSWICLTFFAVQDSLLETMILYGFILPILVNASVNGQRGALLVALAASLIAGSRVIQSQLPLSAHPIQHLLFQIFFFNIVALVTSTISDRGKLSEVKYRGLFQGVPVGLYRATIDGRFQDVNPAFSKITGCHCPSERCPLNLTDFFKDEEDKESFKKSLNHPPHFFNQEQIWHCPQNNQSYWVRHTCKQTVFSSTGEVFLQGCIVDISETREMLEANKRLEEQLQQNHKMEALGTLTSGIAHDFNNLLQSGIGYVQKLLRSRNLTPEQHATITHIDSVLDKSGNLVRRILAFSRKVPLAVQAVDINAAINSMAPILTSGVSSSITVEFLPDEDIGHIAADLSQIEQVVLNLVTNAADAMPSGGTITITTEPVFFEERQESLSLEPGEYVGITVKDTGQGMTRDVRQRIFEPFYTTKPLDHGTGLGLSLVYGIVTAHKGHITCSSCPGNGTTFSIVLPCTRELPSSSDIPKQIKNTSNRPLQILLVDDEDMIRETVREGLELSGHAVQEASGGAQALEILATRAFDIMILDLGMPGMSGEDCLKKLQKLAPDNPPKIIVASGCVNSDIIQNPETFGADLFLPKPYKIEMLETAMTTLVKTDKHLRMHIDTSTTQNRGNS